MNDSPSRITCSEWAGLLIDLILERPVDGPSEQINVIISALEQVSADSRASLDALEAVLPCFRCTEQQAYHIIRRTSWVSYDNPIINQALALIRAFAKQFVPATTHSYFS